MSKTKVLLSTGFVMAIGCGGSGLYKGMLPVGQFSKGELDVNLTPAGTDQAASTVSSDPKVTAEDVMTQVGNSQSNFRVTIDSNQGRCVLYGVRKESNIQFLNFLNRGDCKLAGDAGKAYAFFVDSGSGTLSGSIDENGIGQNLALKFRGSVGDYLTPKGTFAAELDSHTK